MGRYVVIQQKNEDYALYEFIRIRSNSLEEATNKAKEHKDSKVYDLNWDYKKYLTLFNNYAKACNKIKELEAELAKVRASNESLFTEP